MIGDVRPPVVARWILLRVLPAALVDEVAGDLHEEFLARAQQHGARRARRWYRRTALWATLRILTGRGHRPEVPPHPGRSAQRLRLPHLLAQDFRQAMRPLGRRPALAMTTIGATAAGIGAIVLMLALISAVYLTPLPYPDADRLVLIASEFEGVNEGGFAISHLEGQDIVAETDVFEDVAFSLDWQSANALVADREPERVALNFVSANHFDLLGAAMVLGRSFRHDDDLQGRPARVVILSHHYWVARFGADPTVAGTVMQLNGAPVEVIGVLAGEPPDLSTRFGNRADVFLPLQLVPAVTDLDLTSSRRSRYLTVLGKVTAGTPPTLVREQLQRVADRLATDESATNAGWRFSATPLRDVLFSDARSIALLLAAGATLVLILVGANLANLELIRYHDRLGELAVRRALGASPRRLATQLLTESVARTVAGGSLGIVVAWLSLAAAGTLPALALPAGAAVGIDALTLAQACGLTVALGIAVGLLPAVDVWRTTRASLGAGSLRVTDSRRGVRTRAALVVVEVALACCLLAGAAHVFLAFQSLQALGVGYDPGNLASVRLELRSERYDPPDMLRQTARDLEDRARGVPGVREAFLWSPSPLGGGNWVAFLARPGLFDADPTSRVEASRHHIRPGALRALGIPLVEGRDFSATDDDMAPRVVIISNALARHLWPGESPLEHEVELRLGGERLRVRVVGVAADAQHRDRLQNPFGPQRDIYLPFDQHPQTQLSLVLRVQESASFGSVIQRLGREVARLDAGLPLFDATLVSDRLHEEEHRSRFSSAALAAFAGLALLLAVIGTSGVLAHSVARQRRDLGIRVALGASPPGLMTRVAGRGLALVGAGIALGLVAATWLADVLSAAVVGVDTASPWPLIVAAIAVGVSGFMACAIPARRTLSIDPAQVLKPS